MLFLAACRGPESEPASLDNIVPTTPSIKGPNGPPSVDGPTSAPPTNGDVSEETLGASDAMTEKETVRYTLPEESSFRY